MVGLKYTFNGKKSIHFFFKITQLTQVLLKNKALFFRRLLINPSFFLNWIKVTISVANLYGEWLSVSNCSFTYVKKLVYRYNTFLLSRRAQNLQLITQLIQILPWKWSLCRFDLRPWINPKPHFLWLFARILLFSVGDLFVFSDPHILHKITRPVNRGICIGWPISSFLSIFPFSD